MGNPHTFSNGLQSYNSTYPGSDFCNYLDKTRKIQIQVFFHHENNSRTDYDGYWVLSVLCSQSNHSIQWFPRNRLQNQCTFHCRHLFFPNSCWTLRHSNQSVYNHKVFSPSHGVSFGSFFKPGWLGGIPNSQKHPVDFCYTRHFIFFTFHRHIIHFSNHSVCPAQTASQVDVW